MQASLLSLFFNLFLSQFLLFPLVSSSHKPLTEEIRLENNVDLQIMRVSRIIRGLPCTPVKMRLGISVKTCLEVTGTPVKFC